MATFTEQGSLPRNLFGKVVGGESDGRGRLVGQQVSVVRGDELPLGLQGIVAWHGEISPFFWRVGIEVDDGLAIVWGPANHVTATPLSLNEPTDCPF